jgi:membrane protein implicated in regulation of membrane protease activity
LTWLALRVNERTSGGPVVSAVIYAAIVVMWAVVLVPMWLRRRDAATESRSVERFSTAMRTLSRRTHATPGRRYVVMPRRQPGTVSIHVSGAAATAAASPRAGRATRPVVGAARASMVRRRRRTTLALLGLVTLTALFAMVGMFPWLAQLVVDVLLVGFLAHLRTQARRAAAVARQRGRGSAAAARPATRRERPAKSAPAIERPARPVAEPAPAAVVSDADVTWTADTAVPSPAVEVEVVVDETWQPVPVPPPTYTLKPPAPSPAAASYDPDATEEMERVVDDAPTELDEILERRWAVND